MHASSRFECCWSEPVWSSIISDMGVLDLRMHFARDRHVAARRPQSACHWDPDLAHDGVLSQAQVKFDLRQGWPEWHHPGHRAVPRAILSLEALSNRQLALVIGAGYGM